MPQIFPNPVAQAVITELVRKTRQSVYESDTNLYKNKIDPFSAIIDSMLQGITLDNWIRQEKVRQNQKTLQNCIGNLHQDIIASFPGWENLGTGNIVDVYNGEEKVVAEIKNKFNTTKGNHKIQIYRDLEATLSRPEYSGCTGYYVEVIPSGKGVKTVYDKPFTPSDNTRQGQRAVLREDIRVIDGRSFYKLVTGHDDALSQLYHSLPLMIRSAMNQNVIKPEEEALFEILFQKAFV